MPLDAAFCMEESKLLVAELSAAVALDSTFRPSGRICFCCRAVTAVAPGLSFVAEELNWLRTISCRCPT